MECKCKYFLTVNGILVCSVCGKPAHAPPVEDKLAPVPATKKKSKHEVK